VATDWREPTGRERLVSGRRADVLQRKRFVNGTWVDSTTRYRRVVTSSTPPPPPPLPPGDLPAAPAGYTTWYQVDFRNIGTALPALWTPQNRAGGNSAGTYRPQNLAVVPGVGLVHTAERASVGAPIYTGGAYGRINIPQFRWLRFAGRCEGFASGTWPSGWERPQAGGAMQGEKDTMEGFGGHLHYTQYPRIFGGGYIATSPSPYNIGLDTVDFRIPASEYEATHVYETKQVRGAVTFYCDGVDRGTVNAAGMSTAAARSAWAAQFDDPSATWYFRTDFQISGTGSQAGVTNGGPLSDNQVGKFARWIVEWIQVFVPA
jgi:hypothetical protein